MRVVRWAVPVAGALVILAMAFLGVRSGRLSLPTLGRPASPQATQAQPSSPATPSALDPREVVRRVASVRPSLFGITAVAGWAVSLLLALLLVRLVGRWRTAFEQKEWILLPSDHAGRLETAVVALTRTTGKHLEGVSHRVATAGEDIRTATVAIHETRSEFSILRDELDKKAKEVAALRLGQEFHTRRPILMRMIRALEIIDDDVANQRDTQQTLEGVRVELRECLEDNAISVHTPAPGTQISETRGVDIQGAKQEKTQDESLRGTIASTDRPAYIARGPQGAEEVLVPAKVRVYV